jgi:hypothetical protein
MRFTEHSDLQLSNTVEDIRCQNVTEDVKPCLQSTQSETNA